MKENNAFVKSEIGPDLFKPPHVLPALMELFAGERQTVFSLQEQMLAHLATCHYCRNEVMVLLIEAQEYDRRNNDPEEPARDLLMLFANIDRAIDSREAHEYERLGTYVEAIVHEGKDKANQRFPGIAAHMITCSACRSVLEKTLEFITESEETH